MRQVLRRYRLIAPYLLLAPGREEFLFVLAGRLVVWLDERECLEPAPGDALTFASSIPHRFVALGRDETRILWVNTPPTF